MTEKDDQYYDRADAHIQLANQHVQHFVYEFKKRFRKNYNEDLENF